MTDSALSATAEFRPLPTAVSGVIALVAAAVATGLVAETAAQRSVLAVALVGVAAVAAGGRLWRLGHALFGAVVALCGTLVVVVAVGEALSRPETIVGQLVLLPGILGLWTLAAALVPIRFGRRRLLVDAGAALVFLAVVTSGVVRGASTPALVGAGAATILAWDAAENAVSMGGQMGSEPGTATARAELVHAGVGGGLAVGAVAAVLGVSHLGIDGLPFAALLALLVAGVALALVAHG
ncbi:DUF7519 family protein [Halobaculum rarum]|uniref:DUF7519 family protein n=1 Tax=Halobaculum rarum TaxID=3075122 RepID=UPI0032AE91E8